MIYRIDQNDLLFKYLVLCFMRIITYSLQKYV